MSRITLGTREDCHLCEEAHAALEQARAQVPFDLAVVDLDREADPERRRLYDWEVPVVELDGRKIMKFRVDEARLLRLLAAALPPDQDQA
jgi:glutaredoxin